MKKINYLILPLLAVPFFIDCGCSNANCDKVTEEVFNAAIKNEGVTHVQANVSMKIYYEDSPISIETNFKISPDKIYYDNIDPEETLKVYVWSISSTKYKYSENGGNGWSEEKEDDKDNEDGYWNTPKSVSCSGMHSTIDFTFSKYTYDKSGYYAEFENLKSNEGTSLDKMSIFFKNKRVTKTSYQGYNEDAETKKPELAYEIVVNYTYNKITPKDPR